MSEIPKHFFLIFAIRFDNIFGITTDCIKACVKTMSSIEMNVLTGQSKATRYKIARPVFGTGRKNFMISSILSQNFSEKLSFAMSENKMT